MAPPRNKMKRRLLFLATGFLVAVFAIGALYIYRKHRIGQHFLHLRAEGLAAVKAGDYPTGVNDLGAYLGQNPTDLPSLKAYAKASLKVPQPGGRNLYQAIGVLHQILYQLPGNLKYQRMLLKLLVQTNANVEAVGLARQILKEQPRNLNALSGLATALTRLRKLRQAFGYAAECIELSPDRINEGLLAIDLMRERQLPDNRIIAWAQALIKKHPRSAACEFMLASAELATGNAAEASAMNLKLAARRHLPKNMILPLTRQLDLLQHASRATQVLRNAVADGAGKSILEALCDRLYQQGHNRQVLSLTKSIAPAQSAVLAAYRARSLLALHQSQAAAAIISGLKKLSAPEAQNWAAVLSLRLKKHITDADRLAVLRAAESTFPGQPYFIYRLANGYLRVREPVVAQKLWGIAAMTAPTWSAPLRALAMEAVRAGDVSLGGKLINRAVELAPNSTRTLITQALIQAVAAPLNPRHPPRKILRTLHQLAQKYPENNSLITALVRIYAQTGRRAEARGILAAALQRRPPLPLNAMLTLYSLNKAMKLHMSGQIIQRAKSEYGLVPPVGLIEAVQLAAAKHPRMALKLLHSGLGQASAEKGRWRIVIAEYLTIEKSPGVKNAWKTAVAANPHSARVLWLAIAAPEMVNNRKFMLSAFDGLEKIIGSNGFAWKMAKADWLLAHQPTPADVTLAVRLLHEDIGESNNVLGPHLLLASEYQKEGKIAQAINQLQVAYALAPRNPGLALTLAKLYQQQGRLAHAGRYLADVAGSSYATPAQQKQAAALFAIQGHNSKAISLLTSRAAGGKLGRGRALLLAQLYQRDGNNTAAAQLYTRLLHKPSAAVLASAANFYGDTGHMKQAEALLAQLAALKLPPGEADLIAGDFYLNHNMPAAARGAYNAAVQAAPKRLAPWLSLLNFELSLNDASAVKNTLAAAIEQRPHNGTLAFLNDNLAAALKVNAVTIFRPLVSALLISPPPDGARSIVPELAADLAGKPADTAISGELQAFVTRYPQYLALRNATAKVLLAAGQAPAAAVLAIKTMARFPTDPTSARLAALAYLQQHNWASCLNAATDWRRRLNGGKLPADLVMATADVNLGDPAGALSRIAPYLSAARKNPEGLHQVLLLAAQANISQGDVAAAESLLWPAIPRSAAIRIGAASMAAGDLSLNTAQRWLNEIAKYIPAGKSAGPETLALAQGWWGIGQRFNNMQIVGRAETLIRGMLSGGQTLTKPQQIQLLSNLATIELVRGQDASAIGVYDKVLALDPRQVIAMNNLAILLLRQSPVKSANISRAAELMQQATSLAPNSSTVWDTFARVQAVQGNFTAALHSMAKAKSLDPNNPLWPVDTAAILLQSGQTAKARTVLGAFQPAPAQLQELSINARKHYRELQAKLGLTR